MDLWSIHYFTPCLLMISLFNMKTFTKTAPPSRGVSNVVKPTSLTHLVKIRLLYRGSFPFSALSCNIMIGTSTRCANYPRQRTYNHHSSGSMQTRRASWTGSPNLSKDARGMEKLGRDWRKISIGRRRPWHDFWDPTFLIKTRTAYLQGRCQCQRNQMDSDPQPLWNGVYLQ